MRSSDRGPSWQACMPPRASRKGKSCRARTQDSTSTCSRYGGGAAGTKEGAAGRKPGEELLPRPPPAAGQQPARLIMRLRTSSVSADSRARAPRPTGTGAAASIDPHGPSARGRGLAECHQDPGRVASGNRRGAAALPAVPEVAGGAATDGSARLYRLALTRSSIHAGMVRWAGYTAHGGLAAGERHKDPTQDRGRTRPAAGRPGPAGVEMSCPS